MKVMGIRLRLAAFALLAVPAVGCAGEDPKQSESSGETAVLEHAAAKPNSAAPLAEGNKKDLALPSDKTAQSEWIASIPPDLREVFALTESIGPTASRDFSKAVGKLQAHGGESIGALRRLYDSAPQKGFLARWKIMQVTASLLVPESLEFLKSVATSPLPAAEPTDGETATPREEEDMIRSRAVVGISRLAQKDVKGSVEVLESLLSSESREVVIAAAMELDLIGKLDARHHPLLKAKGLKTKFEKVDNSFFDLKPDRATPEHSKKPLDKEPAHWDANN